MTLTEQTLNQIQRALRKVASKFSAQVENMPLTDIYMQVKQDSGELRIYNDDGEELTRCVVEEWIGNADEDFYASLPPLLINAIETMRDTWEALPILKPYSFVLMGEDKEMLTDLYLVDDDLFLMNEDLMQNLDQDLDQFLDELMSNNDA